MKTKPPLGTIRLRSELRAGDRESVRSIVRSTGFFTDAEIAIAVELVDERERRGEESGYLFLFAEEGQRVLGYTCYGEIACTVGSYDLYWIAVDDALRGRGIGRRLLEETETAIAARGGRRVYIETSGRELYRPTQSFYTRSGYRIGASLEDFYAPGDPKLVFVKALAGRASITVGE